MIVALSVLVLPAMVQAQFTFTTNNGAITITGYNTAAGLDAVIPAMTNGYPVTSIGDDAFYYTGITNVTIPNSVTSIGFQAFFACTNLTSMTIPDGVTNIGNAAFDSCTSLTSITVDASNTAYSSLGGVLFDKAQTTLLEFLGGLGGSYTIPNSVTSIGNAAFEFCISLTSVTIGTNVTSIGTAAFAYCTGLTSVTIPNSVTSIGDTAFYNCTSLRSAYFVGNAPRGGGGRNAFNGYYGPDPAAVYYLAGTTRWGPTFGGVPAVLWNPQAKAMIFTGGQFGFNVTGLANAVIVVEACTNLSHPVWLPVSTNTLSSSGDSSFGDPQSKTNSTRYYRFRSP